MINISQHDLHFRFAFGLALIAIGVVDDIRTRKFHNKLFLAFIALVFVWIAIGQGLKSVWPALGDVFIIFFILMPFVFLRVIGAGDMKLMMAVAPLIGYVYALHVALISLIWGIIFGILRSVLQLGLFESFNKIKTNLVYLWLKKSDQLDSSVKFSQMQKMPFTVPIMLAWMTQWQIAYLGLQDWWRAYVE